jgi:hypothetical protein
LLQDSSTEIWEISIVNELYGIGRGVKTKIYEIYIPDWNVSFNYYRKVNIIIDSKKRYEETFLQR